MGQDIILHLACALTFLPVAHFTSTWTPTDHAHDSTKHSANVHAFYTISEASLLPYTPVHVYECAPTGACA